MAADTMVVLGRVGNFRSLRHSTRAAAKAGRHGTYMYGTSEFLLERFSIQRILTLP